MGLCVPMGRMNPDQMDEMARLSDEYGNREIRFTTGQNAIIPNVPEARLDRMLAETLLEEFQPHPAPLRRAVVACTGTDYCNLAQIDTKGYAASLLDQLEDRLAGLTVPVGMNWSGCPASCGNHQASDVGFRGMKARIDGKMVDAVAIYTGGRTGPGAVAGREILGLVPCDDKLPDVVANVIRNIHPPVGADNAPEAIRQAPHQELALIGERLAVPTLGPATDESGALGE